MKYILMFAGAAALALAGPAVAKPGHGHGNGHAREFGEVAPFGYGAGGCPPGLAKKSPACIPPGQAKKLFGVGQRVPLGYGGLIGYDALPYGVRDYYGPQLDPYSNYVYDNNYLYRVDPRTMLVEQVLNALIRPY